MEKFAIHEILKSSKNRNAEKAENDFINVAHKYLGASRNNYYFRPIHDFIKLCDCEVVIKRDEEIKEDVFNIEHSYESFRGYHIGHTITLFYSKYETQESMVFVLFHELFHEIVSNDETIRSIFNMINQLNTQKFLTNARRDGLIDVTTNIFQEPEFKRLYDESDYFHDNLSEEHTANDFATALIGFKYDRAWWRQQIQNEKYKKEKEARQNETTANNTSVM
jgi:hypothetical protein